MNSALEAAMRYLKHGWLFMVGRDPKFGLGVWLFGWNITKWVLPKNFGVAIELQSHFEMYAPPDVMPILIIWFLQLLHAFFWFGLVFTLVHELLGTLSLSLWSNVSNIAFLKVLSKCICHCLCHCHCHCACLRRCLFAGQVMFSHRPDQMSQRSKVSKIALWRCSLNVFVFVFVFLFANGQVMFSHDPHQFCEVWKALNPKQWICRTVS